MVVVASQLPADLLHPRSLLMLMGIYERNYQRFVRLFGDPSSLPGRRRMRLAGRPQLYLTVLARSSYTVELALTHVFAGEKLPDLRVRLYRDARLAEALPPREIGRVRDPMARVEPRWQANLLFYKWLEYCLEAAAKGDAPLAAARA